MGAPVGEQCHAIFLYGCLNGVGSCLEEKKKMRHTSTRILAAASCTCSSKGAATWFSMRQTTIEVIIWERTGSTPGSTSGSVFSVGLDSDLRGGLPAI